MALIANFSYTVAGLIVTFDNHSSNDGGPAISTYAWNFGDGQTSVLENPIITYTAAGIYGVTLVVGDGVTTSTITRYILLTSISGYVPVTILEMVLMKVPPTLFPVQNLITYIQRYQLILKDAPDPEISLDLVFNEASWPSVYNILIAELVALEAIRQMASIFAASGSISQLISSSSTSTEETEPELKRVKTGPAEAEWYSKFENASSITEQYANYYDTIFGKGEGLMAELQKSVCLLASSIGVYLPTICGDIKGPYITLDIVTPKDLPDATDYFLDHPLSNL